MNIEQAAEIAQTLQKIKAQQDALTKVKAIANGGHCVISLRDNWDSAQVSLDPVLYGGSQQEFLQQYIKLLETGIATLLSRIENDY